MLRLLSMTQVDGPGLGQASSTERFLAQIADPTRPRISGRVVVVVAHPDDETLGCGALLPRLDDVRLVHVTDGAPRSGLDAARAGFSSPEAYAAARQRELAAALALAGVPITRCIGLGIADQATATQLAAIARRLVPLIADAEIVLTHSYEGGHPDHDATAAAIEAACRLLGGGRAPAIVEMPFYRADSTGSGWIRQSFAEDGPAATFLRLSDVERARKRAMLDAHASQRATLESFGAADEVFRPAPARDFSAPPPGGLVLYDSFGWAMTGARFNDVVREAWRELGFKPA
jgi:LmbE family N-acetylglucosaminyl deacetylase